jgi:hypothetical protein
MTDITRVIEQTHREIGSKRIAVSQATGTVLLRRRYFEGIGAGWDPAPWALELHLRDEPPDDLADRWRAGEVPAEVQELIQRSAQEWRALAAKAGGTGSRASGGRVEGASP